MRGRPILGAFCGLLFGVFVAIDLFTFRVHRLDSLSVIGFPLIGLVLGMLLGIVHPFARGRVAPAYAAGPVADDGPGTVVSDEG